MLIPGLNLRTGETPDPVELNANATDKKFNPAGAGFSCAPLSTDVDNLNIPGGRLVPRLRPDSVMVTDVPLVIAAPVVMMIAVLVDVDAEATPVQDGTLHVTVAEPRK